MTHHHSQNQGEPGQGGRISALSQALRRAALSLPGKLLFLTIAFIMVAQILIFLPSAASFRTDWMQDRAAAAHLAALASDASGDQMIGRDVAEEILEGLDAIAVSRVWDGFNELLLGTKDVPGNLKQANLNESYMLENMLDTLELFFVTEERYLLIQATPASSPETTIFVIVPEGPLRDELIGYSYYILGVSIFTSLLTGGLIYIALLVILVRPIRQLVRSMTLFQADPLDASRQIQPSKRQDEIGEAELALASMQNDVRDALQQRERLAALGGAVAKINHDLRNVLSSAQLMSDRLAMSKDERTATIGERLVRAISRGIKLCQDVLAYGRTQERAAELQRTDLHHLVEEAAQDAMATIVPARWHNHIALAQCAWIDRDQTYRIFLNLFRNALQAMEDQEGPVLEVKAAQGDDMITVTVCDSGPGIPAHVQEHLFKPFSASTRVGGSGLGLSIARELARSMDGDIRLAQTGETGTCFEVRLKPCLEERSA